MKVSDRRRVTGSPLASLPLVVVFAHLHKGKVFCFVGSLETRTLCYKQFSAACMASSEKMHEIMSLQITGELKAA